MAYEMNLTLDMPFTVALEKITEALKENHLGIVSDVDVQAIFRNKLDKEVPDYHIYGACNPGMADRVLQAEPNAGTLLPCNFVLYTKGDQTVVSFMDPVTVLNLSGSAEVRAVAEEAKTKIKSVIERLK